MESFVDKIAVVTGGGTGMGRELLDTWPKRWLSCSHV